MLPDSITPTLRCTGQTRSQRRHPLNHTIRPNTILSYTPSMGSASQLMPPISLQAANIKDLLRDYPDQKFVDTLVSISTNGARIGYEGPLTRTIRPNHSSPFVNAEVITESIISELGKGRLRVVDTLPPYYFVSPLGLVPKKSDGVQTGWRTIFDLSTPEGESVNDGIPKEYGAITYEDLDDAIRLILKHGKGAVLMKRDLKSAFRHIPISPSDYWLLIFEWQGKFSERVPARHHPKHIMKCLLFYTHLSSGTGNGMVGKFSWTVTTMLWLTGSTNVQFVDPQSGLSRLSCSSLPCLTLNCQPTGSP
jgi:hypothetical protein